MASLQENEPRLREASSLLADLGSEDAGTRAKAIAECRRLAPDAGAVLAALLQGLNSSDEMVRLGAWQGFLRMFPAAEASLDEPMNDAVSADPKVRLAAIHRVITILLQKLGVPTVFPPSGKQPDQQIKEDLMDHAGRWVAWGRDRQRIVAVADTYAEVMTQALAAGEADPFVKKAQGIPPAVAGRPFILFDDESAQIVEDVRALLGGVAEADAWLDSPHEWLEGERPRDLIGTEREPQLRYLLRGIKYGITT